MWQANVLRHMCSWMLHEPDPDEKLRSWLDEAAEGDDEYIRWVLSTWHKMRDLTTLDLEKLAWQTNLWQAHRNFGSDEQRAP